ncbi:DUF2796 domain-containing protein [uncultured Roseobacter sp.]|uniref:zinc uptake protein ZrgA n=1 Tax=uncultured Roseobacter sp. TaxID=114847 RepID=UPI002625F8F4|nr:DUF2796 domain-containing protein [uncultured Roseobacter sp.]
MKRLSALVPVFLAVPAFADAPRQLDAHEHGVGQLNMALDGDTVVLELHAPGADIVGFEYAAKSAEDRAAIDAAVATLARPLELFLMPAAAECSVVQASAELEGADAHDAHEHHDHDGHDHAGHDDHDHAAETEESGHSEFHAQYRLRCANPDALSEITFAYFDTFENARKLDVQIVSPSGAVAAEVTHDAPELNLRGMF